MYIYRPEKSTDKKEEENTERAYVLRIVMMLDL